MPKPHKLVVVGVGHVGSYVLADAMKMDLFGEIVTIDKDKGVAFGEALDQFQATGLTSIASIAVRAGGYEEVRDADVVICAAGPSMKPDPENPNAKPDRAALAGQTSEVIREVMRGITANVERGKEPVVILITNPLDTMVYIAENEFDYPRGKVFGTGTMLDSARLRRIVADKCGVSPDSVSGYMMGEHGLAAFPALSHLSIGGIPASSSQQYFGVELDPAELADAVVTAAYDVFNGKGWTNAGVAQSAVLMARHVLLDERAIVPACTTLRGEYGHDGDIAFSMPCLLTKNGIEARYEIPLSEWEKDAMERSNQAIFQAMKDAGTGPDKAVGRA